ncbi:hypothetical protein [Radicibacter daui]|uniref:hypothetical protein n=1 Tax=Radicibacter daui TaxID=3064829 RepID=UPI004046A1D9
MSDVTFFETDLFIPAYRSIRRGEWEILISELNFAGGYWSDAVLVRNMAGLIRDGSTWMSMTPMEIESQEIGVRLSRGDVVILGMGMGWAAAVTALRDEVSSVTVVELDADVLALHEELDIFSQLPEAARRKISIVHGSAFSYRPTGPVDFLMADIWLPLRGDNRVDEVKRMQENIGAQAIYFWGQELEIGRLAALDGEMLTPEGIQRIVERTGLPLVGLEYPAYDQLLSRAVARHLRSPQ